MAYWPDLQKVILSEPTEDIAQRVSDVFCDDLSIRHGEREAWLEVITNQRSLESVYIGPLSLTTMTLREAYTTTLALAGETAILNKKHGMLTVAFCLPGTQPYQLSTP